MRSFILAALFTALAGAAYAHPATEQYIPIGQSPGGGTLMGRAEAVVEPAAAGGEPAVSIAGAPSGPFVIGPNTRIYIDRSAQRLPSLIGTIDDVRPGRIIEVRIADPETRVAEWVKVRP